MSDTKKWMCLDIRPTGQLIASSLNYHSKPPETWMPWCQIAIEDLNGLNVIGLKDFLRARGVCTKGVKKDLLRLAKLYFSYPVLRLQDGTGPGTSTSASGATAASASRATATTTSSIFDDNSFGWKQIVSGDIISIPKQFTIEEISHYITTIQVSLVVPTQTTGSESDDGDSDVAAGTLKPTVKGRQMYVSKHPFEFQHFFLLRFWSGKFFLVGTDLDMHDKLIIIFFYQVQLWAF